MRGYARVLVLSAALLQQGGFAHDEFSTLWYGQNPPLLLAGLALVALYARGTAVLWKRGEVGRGVRPLQAVAFAAGLVALFAAFLSPLDALSDAFFSAHMVQHLLTILVAAPLIVLGIPLLPLLWSMPGGVRQRFGRLWLQAKPLRVGLHILLQPLLVWSLYALTLWLWHLPALYQRALRNEWIHGLEHLTLLLSAYLFWWTVLQPLGRRRLSLGLGVLFIFTTMLQSGGLGAMLTFAQRPLYPSYETTLQPWPLTPLEDQQLAGLLMWLSPGLLYLVLALFLLAKCLEEQSNRDSGSHLDGDGLQQRGHLR